MSTSTPIRSRTRLALLPVLCLTTALGACDDVTGPPVPAASFLFHVRNIITEDLGDPAASEILVEFSVAVPDSTSELDLAEIQQVMVTWPNGLVNTRILSGFLPQDSVLVAKRILERDEGLLAGTYTLTVSFLDGQEVTKTRYYDGALLDSPEIGELIVDSTSISISWHAPDQAHDWTVWVKRSYPEPEEVVSPQPVTGHSGGGGGFGAGMDVDLEAGARYHVVLELENAFNRRTVLIPFTLSG